MEQYKKEFILLMTGRKLNAGIFEMQIMRHFHLSNVCLGKVRRDGKMKKIHKGGIKKESTEARGQGFKK